LVKLNAAAGTDLAFRPGACQDIRISGFDIKPALLDFTVRFTKNLDDLVSLCLFYLDSITFSISPQTGLDIIIVFILPPTSAAHPVDTTQDSNLAHLALIFRGFLDNLIHRLQIGFQLLVRYAGQLRSCERDIRIVSIGLTGTRLEYLKKR